MEKKVIITGGTGFLGTNCARYLFINGFKPILIARNEPKEDTGFEFRRWDGRTAGDWAKSLEDAVAIINLAGRSVDCIKTPENCDQILRSRVESTRAIGLALRQVQNPPPVWVQMSTAHIYGDPLEVVCDEDSAFGYGLAPFVGEAWERAFAEAALPQMRQVVLRTSFVLGSSGGAMGSLQSIVRMRMGGKAGHGRQGISWIHEEDMNRLFYRAIVNEQMQGAYIASSPHPVSNAEFMQTLRKTMGIRIGLPAPALMTRLGAKILFQTDPELVLHGRYVKSKRLDEEEFEFKFPFLTEALEEVVNAPHSRIIPSSLPPQLTPSILP
jgi:uncharacterized protein (TIGR01777 family)